nr:cache domain-containing protein [Acidobacteriota bacterium]
MTIRGRLLTLAVGGVVPLLVVGLAVLWAVWGGKQQQLNESLEQQAELAAVVFDRWLDAQRQPLLTIASYPAARLQDPSALEADLRAALLPRPHWVDLRVVDAGGRVVAAHPAGADPLPEGVTGRLLD